MDLIHSKVSKLFGTKFSTIFLWDFLKKLTKSQFVFRLSIQQINSIQKIRQKLYVELFTIHFYSAKNNGPSPQLCIRGDLKKLSYHENIPKLPKQFLYLVPVEKVGSSIEVN